MIFLKQSTSPRKVNGGFWNSFNKKLCQIFKKGNIQSKFSREDVVLQLFSREKVLCLARTIVFKAFYPERKKTKFLHNVFENVAPSSNVQVFFDRFNFYLSESNKFSREKVVCHA